MLKMADISVDFFLPIIAESGADVAFLSPTPTGFTKSIMDATGPVRKLLKSAGLHDYEVQGQGPDNKVTKHACFVHADGYRDATQVSLYRPVTKKGDPRIWFSGLTRYCAPRNLLALTVIENVIYVINLSNPEIAESLLSKGPVFDRLSYEKNKKVSVADELLRKIMRIHNQGYLRSITMGDPGVGDTLENALGISRNPRKTPDYKGIELKSTRLGRKHKTRNTIFTRVPDKGLTYRQILDTYGKIQTPKDRTEPRFQIYDTLRVSRTNSYGLQLSVDENLDTLNMYYTLASPMKYVSTWYIQSLQEALLEKHKETFWVYASTKTIDGIEYFRYDKIVHTQTPNASLLSPLLQSDVITADLAVHTDLDGKNYKDHGVMFKIFPENRHMLFPGEKEYSFV